MILGLAEATPAFAATPQPGWTVTDFATGFASCCSQRGGNLGPSGVAFGPDGNLYVINTADGNLYRFGPLGGVAGPGTLVGSVGSTPLGLAFGLDGRLYVVRQAANDIVEINPLTAAVVRTVVSGLGCLDGLATDPLSGDLFTGGYCITGLKRIHNPQTVPVVTDYVTSFCCADGIAFAADGTIYTAGISGASDGSIFRVSGTASAPPPTAATIATVPTGDGIAISRDGSFIAVNRNDGNLTRVDLPSGVQTPIFTAGSRGDFLAVGGDGCIYATQTDRILKVTRADGSCDLTPTRRDATTTAFACAPVTVPVGVPTTCTVRVTDTNTVFASTPTTTAYFGSNNPGSGVFSAPTCTLTGSGPTSSCSVVYTPSAPGPRQLIANYSGDPAHAPSFTDTTLDVPIQPTSSGLACAPPDPMVDIPTVCTITVTAIGPGITTTPSGTAFFGFPGDPSHPTCTLSGSGAISSCSTVYTPSAEGFPQLTANYLGDPGHSPSFTSVGLTVARQPTSTSLNCVPASLSVEAHAACTVTVTATGPVATTPVGTVELTSVAGELFSATCSLAGSGASSSCSVQFTPSRPGTAQLGAIYPASRTHLRSSGFATLDVSREATLTTLSCTPATTTAGTPAVCTATVTATNPGATTTPVGTISLSGGSGAFVGPTCLLAGAGASASCTATYTPAASGTETLGAAYGGSFTLAPSSGSTSLQVTPRSTATTLSCAPAGPIAGTATSCTATVTDSGAGASTPTGTVSFTQSGAGTFSTPSCALTGSGISASCSVTYTPSAAAASIVTGTYGGDTTHAISSGTATVTSTTRPTGSSLVCTPATVTAGTPTTCIATVTDSGPGVAGTPTGMVTFTSIGGGTLSSPSCVLAGTGTSASCSVTFTPTAAGTATVTATYSGDATHSASSATASLTVTAATTCGSGGHDRQEGDNHEDGRDLRHSEGSLRNHQNENHHDQDGGDCKDDNDHNDNHHQGGDDHASGGHHHQPPPRRERESD